MEFQGLKYAAFDLDGTILDENGKLLEGVVDGIEALIKHDILPIIVTGRSLDSFLGLRFDETFLRFFDPVVLLNEGNVTFHQGTREVTSELTLSMDLLPYLLRTLDGKTGYVVESGGRHYASDRMAALKFSMVYNVPREYVQVVDFVSWKSSDLTRIVVLPQGQIDLLPLAELFDCKVTDVLYINSVEISPLGVCKAKTLARHLRDRHNEQDLSRVIAFGDGRNDSNMLQNCRIGVAVQFSHEQAVINSDIHLDISISAYLQLQFSREHSQELF